MASPTKTDTAIRTMDLPAAMREIIANRRVARLEWNNHDYCWLNGDWLSIFRDDSAENPGEHRWLVNKGDMLAQDWFVVS